MDFVLFDLNNGQVLMHADSMEALNPFVKGSHAASSVKGYDNWVA